MSEQIYRGWKIIPIPDSPGYWWVVRPGDETPYSSQPSVEFAKKMIDHQIKYQQTKKWQGR